jgi:NAD(P)-dependent dehydrogenase (short-subunit alcohol dehydrogenase family)
MAQRNKTALVTGASRGIGRATALALAAAGAHGLVHYGRSAREAESLVAAIQTKGGRANAISADLGNSGRRRAAGQTGARHRRRSIGCARAQRRNRQGGTDRGLHDREF